MPVTIKQKRKTSWFNFSGDFYLPMLIISFLFLLVGIGLYITVSIIDFDPSAMSFTIWTGMCLMCMSLAFLIYMSYGPNAEVGLFWKIIIPIITFGVLAGLYFVFREHLFATYTRFDGDQETIHVAILSNIIAATLISICFMLFRLFDVEEKHYIILMIISIGIAFICMVIGNFVKLFWAAIIEFCANLISTIIMLKFIGVASGAYGGDFYPSVGSTYETSDGHKLEYRGGGKFIDESEVSYVDPTLG